MLLVPYGFILACTLKKLIKKIVIVFIELPSVCTGPKCNIFWILTHVRIPANHQYYENTGFMKF